MDISISSYDKLPEKYMLGFYYPADFEYDSYGSKEPQNPEFNNYSNMILDLKDNYEYAISNFHKDLSCTLSSVKNIVITTPPTDSLGIKNLAHMLATSNREIEYYIDYFVRPNKGERGNRQIYSNNKYSIENRKIILLDDVVTSGETMEKCKLLLLDAGAKEVKCIALGRTWRNIEEAYFKLKELYNSENSQDDEKSSLDLNNILQKYADILRNLEGCSNDNRAIVYEILSKIKDDIESLENLRNDSGYVLCKKKEEACNVIQGNDTFSYCNILQKPFLW